MFYFDNSKYRLLLVLLYFSNFKLQRFAKLLFFLQLLTKCKQTILVITWDVYLTSQKRHANWRVYSPQKKAASFRLKYTTTNILIEFFQLLIFSVLPSARMSLNPWKNPWSILTPKNKKSLFVQRLLQIWNRCGP